MSIAYYNGNFCNYDDIKIPLSDRCVFFGDGIYDAAIGRNGRIYLEDEHLERFIGNAKKMNIHLPLKKHELSMLLHKTAALNGYTEYFIYFQLTRYSDERIHSYPDTEKSNLLITVKEHKISTPEHELKLITAPDVRYHICNVKTLNLLPNVLASKKAESLGCDEAVFIRNGIVTECAHSNISIIKNGTLYTHPKGKFILPGITRGRLLFLCEKLDISYKEIRFTEKDMKDADEVLITSTTKVCKRVSEIDGTEIKRENSLVGERLIFALCKDFERITC